MKPENMTKDEYKQELEKVKEITKQLKKSLKVHSKSKLIEIIIAYASDLQEMQNVARQLHEELKAIKGEIDEESK